MGLMPLVVLPGIIPLILSVVIFVFVVALVWYLVTTFIPEPLKKFSIAIIVVIAVLFLIYFVAQLGQGGDIRLY